MLLVLCICLYLDLWRAAKPLKASDVDLLAEFDMAKRHTL